MVGTTHKKFFTLHGFWKNDCLVPWLTDRNETRQKGMEDGNVKRACCVCSYHVYEETGKVAVGEILACKREPQKAADRYAVAVKKDRTIIGHLPRKVSGLSLDGRYRKRTIWHHSKQPAALCSMHMLLYFVDVIICSKIYFVFFFLVVRTNYENIFTTKISRSTVHEVRLNRTQYHHTNLYNIGKEAWGFIPEFCTQSPNYNFMPHKTLTTITLIAHTIS